MYPTPASPLPPPAARDKHAMMMMMRTLWALQTMTFSVYHIIYSMVDDTESAGAYVTSSMANRMVNISKGNGDYLFSDSCGHVSVDIFDYRSFLTCH